MVGCVYSNCGKNSNSHVRTGGRRTARAATSDASPKVNIGLSMEIGETNPDSVTTESNDHQLIATVPMGHGVRLSTFL